MKILATLTVSRVNNDQAVVDSLCEEFLHGRNRAEFVVELPHQDPEMVRVLARLNKMGLTLRDYSRKGSRIKGEYSYDIRRAYDKDDLDHAQYLRLVHMGGISEVQVRDSDGRLVIEAWRLMPTLRMSSILFEVTIVSDAIRVGMLEAGLKGVQFRELALMPAKESFPVLDTAGNVVRQVTPDDQDHVEKQGKYWELSSSVTLPPMEFQRLVDRNEKPFSGDYSQGVCLHDEYQPAELHYRAELIKAIEPFDFAFTFERIATEVLPVASQRFRQFCLKHELRTKWFPVRIDS